MKTVKTNHPFTKAQLQSLNKELQKISTVKVVPAMRGKKLPALNNYADIQVKHSPFSLDVYLSFMDFSTPDYPKSQLYQIDAKGNVNKNIRSEMNFDTLSDRVSYFGNLEPIDFNF